MIRLEQHRDCSLLSFQEEQALRWFINSSGLASNVNAAISFANGIDRQLLLQCLQAACATHDAIRTRFRDNGDGGFCRLVLPASECLVEFTELSLGETLGDPAVVQAVATFCEQPFVFEDPNWFRVLLIHTAEKSSVIAISMPHVVSDAMSLRILISGIWRDYACLAQDKMLISKTPRYKLVDFVGSQRAWGATADFEDKLHQLVDYAANGIAEVRRERLDEYAKHILSVRPCASVTCTLPPALCIGLERLARRTQAGLPATLVAGAVLAKAKLFKRQRFCLRLPFSNRTSAGSEEIVGFLSNDVPMFLSIDPDQSFLSFIKSIQRNCFFMMRFGAVPWAVLKERLLELPILQSGRNSFEDYLINVFPALGNLDIGDGYCARPFPIMFSGFTSNDLKVGMQTVNGKVTMSLRVGIEQKDVAEHHYMPAFLGVFTEMVNRPDDSVGFLLGDFCAAERMCFPF